MAWKSKREARVDWRARLTQEEAEIVARYDAAETERSALAGEMQLIRNRAIQRIRYERSTEKRKR